MSTDGTYNNISKKEKLQISRVRAKLETNFGSIADLTRLPAALFIVDISKEHIAVAEAKRLNIPTFAIVDTNSDPNVVDFAIPANDDASTSISLITGIITKAIEEGLAERKIDKEAAAEEKENNKTSHDEAEKLAVGTKFKSSDEDGGGIATAKRTAAGKVQKPRRKIN
jgi:small subunit ribosomal protein S2